MRLRPGARKPPPFPSPGIPGEGKKRDRASKARIAIFPAAGRLRGKGKGMGGCGREGEKLLGPYVVFPFPPALHSAFSRAPLKGSITTKLLSGECAIPRASPGEDLLSPRCS